MVRLKKVNKDIMTSFSVMETARESLTFEEYFKNTDQFTFQGFQFMRPIKKILLAMF